MTTITYDREVDAAYIKLLDERCVETRVIGPNVCVDIGESGKVIGIEVFDLDGITVSEILDGE